MRPIRSRSQVALLIALAVIGSVLASALPARADAVAVAAPVVRQALPVGNAATALLPLPPRTIRVLIPISSPFRLTNGPPEFP